MGAVLSHDNALQLVHSVQIKTSYMPPSTSPAMVENAVDEASMPWEHSAISIFSDSLHTEDLFNT
jgi:hypothetical protein